MKKRFLLAAAAVALLAAASQAGAYSLLNTSPGSRLSMRLSMDAIIGNAPVQNAMAAWNAVGIGTSRDTAFFSAITGGTAGSCGRNSVNEVTWSSTNCGMAFGSSTLAVTTTWSSGGRAIEVDMLFNNAKSWSVYSGPLRSSIDLTRVALHELGHAAGLGHPDEAGQSVSAIMNSHISHTDALQPDDIAGAHAIAWAGGSGGGTPPPPTPTPTPTPAPPTCTLTASPSSITAGGSATLTAACSPAATSYTWTNAGFGVSAAGGTVSPSTTTTYSVAGRNAAGTGNTASATVTVQAPLSPDLRLTSVTAPTSATTGQSLALSATVVNGGNASTPPFRVGFYLSQDAAIQGGSDLFLGFCTLPAGLTAGASGSCSANATVQAGMSGTWYLGAIADDTAVVAEAQEVNNARVSDRGQLVIGAASQPVPSCTLAASPALVSAGGSSTLMATCSPAATFYAWANAALPNAAAGGTVTPPATTTYYVTGSNAAGAGNTASVTVTVAPASTPAPAGHYADLWWAGSGENGWGLSIQQHGSNLFTALYVYDAAGRPAWYVLPAGAWDAARTTWSGQLYQPTSSPLSGYTPAQFVPGGAVGDASITFTSGSTATLRATIHGVTTTKGISRQLFGSGSAPLDVGDMWWGGTSQDGWGISLSQQGGTVFGAWYTYGLDGRVTWYVLPTGTWNGYTYSGTFYATTGSPWVGAGYDASRLAVTPVGTLSLSFASAQNATMTYSFSSGPFAGTTQSKAIVRQAF